MRPKRIPASRRNSPISGGDPSLVGFSSFLAMDPFSFFLKDSLSSFFSCGPSWVSLPKVPGVVPLSPGPAGSLPLQRGPGPDCDDCGPDPVVTFAGSRGRDDGNSGSGELLPGVGRNGDAHPSLNLRHRRIRGIPHDHEGTLEPTGWLSNDRGHRFDMKKAAGRSVTEGVPVLAGPGFPNGQGNPRGSRLLSDPDD